MEYPIFYAAEYGYLLILKTLEKDSRAIMNDQDIFGDNLLHYAAKEGKRNIVEFLLKD